MGLVKYFNQRTLQWEIVAASDAANISLHNEYLLDKNLATISTLRAIQKLNNKISQLEHNLAWIYLNGAKGGSGGGGGGGGGMYTITINNGKDTFYTSTQSITINMTINSGTTKKTFYVNAINMATGSYLVQGEAHTSMTPFDFTINNLPSATNYIYLQAYDSLDNYTELVEITVNVGSLSIILNSYPGAIYTVGGNNDTAAGFLILNKTGQDAYLLTYKSRLLDPLAEALSQLQGLDADFGALYITRVPNSTLAGVYSVDFGPDLANADIGRKITYKTVLYQPSIDYTSNYFENSITISSGNSLQVIMSNLGESASEEDRFVFELNNYCTFNVLLYYEKVDVRTFFYRYKVYKGDELFYESPVDTRQAATSGSSGVNCPTNNFPIGGGYKLVFEACATDDFNPETNPNLYSTVTGYFSIKAGQTGTLKDYKGALLARFGSFNFPGEGRTKWECEVEKSGDYYFQSWPVSTGYNKTTLNIINSTGSTGLLTNVYRYMNLSGNTYARIDEFKRLFPNNLNIRSNSLFGTGFYIQFTYEYLTNNPVDLTVLSFGEYQDGKLYKGFEVNSDYITVAFGTTQGIQVPTPVIAENAYGVDSAKKTRTTTVALNVWSTTVKTGANTSQNTFYFALYIDGVMTKCALIPEGILTSAATGWMFADSLYLGCRNDLSNLANCNIYDFKLYAQNQPDLSIIHNYISATEQAHLIQATDGNAVVDDQLDTVLRNKNLFIKGGNTCLLCDTATGEYLDPSTMYSRIASSYTDSTSGYDLDYPIVYIEETGTTSDMYQCVKATWNVTDTIGGVAITKKKWPVKITITTKYGTTVVYANDQELGPTVLIQGTSSLSYNSKNLELVMGLVQEGVEKLLKINGWLPEHEFTLKADVVDSAHVNNVAIGNFVNTTNFIPHFEGSGYSASDNIGKKIKKTSEGFPCLVFMKYSDGSVEDGLNVIKDSDGTVITKVGKTEFMGVYNFNLGRYAYYNLGLKKLKSYVEPDPDKDDKAPQIISEYEFEEPDNIYSMEVGDNFGDTELMFTQADTTISEKMVECRYTPTTEDAAYDAITKNLFQVLARADGNDTQGYNRKRLNVDGKYEDILGEDGLPLKWTSDSTSAGEETITKSIDMEILRKYLVLALVFGMVDSVMKNMVFRTWDSILWVVAFYDMDTAFKKNNRGASNISYDAHFNYFKNRTGLFDDSLNSYTGGVTLFPKSVDDDPSWQYVYAGMCSADGLTPNRLWNIIQQCDARLINSNSYTTTLPGYYWSLRNNELKDPDAFIDQYFSGYINKTGAVMYNYDYRQKYVSYNQVWKEGVGLVANTSSAQTEFLDGTRVSEVRSWFKKRINFLDSVYASFRSGTTASDTYILDEWDSGQKAANTVTSVTILADLKCKIGYAVSSGNTRYIWVDEEPKTYLLETQTEGNLWYLYGGTILKAIPNFNQLGWSDITKAFNFRLLLELNLSGLTVVSFSGANDMSTLENLKILRLTNFKYTGSNSITIGLSGNNNLQELYMDNGCNISSFSLPSSGTLRVLDLTNNGNISTIPTLTVNNITQSCIIGQSGLRVLKLKGTSITDMYGVTRGLINLPSLEELTLPDTLEKLTVSNCGLKELTQTWTATDIPSALQEVDITECENLEVIDLTGQKSLKRLTINNCPNLKKIILANVNVAIEVSIDFTTLTKLETLNIAQTSLFEDLDLRNCPNLSDLFVLGCTTLKRVRCTYNEDNPIELLANAFNNCTNLTTLTGNFLIQGAGVFEGCSSLTFDTLLQSGAMNINFDRIASVAKMFKGCVLLGSDIQHPEWPRILISRLNDAVGNMSEMFHGTSSNFAITRDLFSYIEDGQFKDLNVTDISGIFENTLLWGHLYSETDEDPGLFTHMPNLLSAERAFANSSQKRYIDNNFFHARNSNKLTSVDYIFQNNTQIIAVEDSAGVTPAPLHSKDFFIDLVKCTHTEERTSGSNATPNPDWPYPFEVFGGTNIEMIVDVNEEGKPFLFHVNNINITQKNIYLENRLYSGIHLILDDCDYSYLFGGGKENGVLVPKTITDGEHTYYIPRFVRVTSPFTASYDLHLDLSKINGDIFFDGTMNYLTTPFSGMFVNDVRTIPDDIFKGANTVISLQGFFRGLGLNNLEDEVYDFAEHNIFRDCTKLQDISSIFLGCQNFRMKLAPDMFKNCSLIDVTSAFADSRVVGQLPERLFYMELNGIVKTTITSMLGVFNNCYNLGYDETYEYAVVPIKLDGTTTTWDDHIVANPSSKLAEYSIPHDLFWYCRRNATIDNVLGSFFWPEATIPENAVDGIYPVTIDTKNYIGPNCEIPVDILNGGLDLVHSDRLTYVFSNTRFKPSGTLEPGTYKRGNLYPTGLFYGMTELTSIVGMFNKTVIDKNCMINPDLFAVNEQGDMCPLLDISYAWSQCEFTYRATDIAADLGSPQIDFTMFDGLTNLANASYLFMGTAEGNYGLKEISYNMFLGIDQTGTLKSLNISGMFAYNMLQVSSNAPLFGTCNLAAGANTFLNGIPPTMIMNAQAVKAAGLAPNTEEWTEYKD